MSETKLKNEGIDNVGSTSDSTVGKSGKSLQNKINTIKANCKAEIDSLKDAQGPEKKEIRGKITEIHRRIKSLNSSIEQAQSQIEELSKHPTDSVLPSKYAIKLKKVHINSLKASIQVHEDVLLEYQKELDRVDSLLKKKIEQINSKADIQIKLARETETKRKQAKLQKDKVKSLALKVSKRTERENAKAIARENGLAVLRQHLPITLLSAITQDGNSGVEFEKHLPVELKKWFEIVGQKFDIEGDAELVTKLTYAKVEHKYFSVIREAMVEAFDNNLNPNKLLIVSIVDADVTNSTASNYEFSLYNFKNRSIERLAMQYGFIKHELTNNLYLPVDFKSSDSAAILNDASMFFSDLADKGYCDYIFDAQHNILFKAK